MSEHVLTLPGIEARKRAVLAKAVTPEAKPPAVKSSRGKTIEYRALYVVTFMVFLVAAIVESLIPNSWRKSKDAIQGSIFQRANIGARTCVAYAFMG